jgi:uncharacterized protein YcbK (DUF882 family)
MFDTVNFKWKDFDCKCGCGLNLTNSNLIVNVQKIREYIKKPIAISSGTRCHKHNIAVGGEKKSNHLLGIAVDLVLLQGEPIELYNAIDYLFPNCYGIILYNTFVHFDLRQVRYRGSNLNGKVRVLP